MESPTFLLGASLPRSGHHFLHRSLMKAFPRDLSYCPFHDTPSCCGAVPCTRGRSARVHFQKNHDFLLKMPADLPGCLYVVQYREPVGALLSHAELHVATAHGGRLPSEKLLDFWLAAKMAYFDLFCAKWLGRDPAAYLYVDYNDLVTDPVEAIRRIAERTDLPFRRDAAEAAVRGVSDVNSRGQKFSPRDPRKSPLFREQTFRAIETELMAAVPALADQRRLDPLPDTDSHPIAHAYRGWKAARIGKRKLAHQHFSRAARLAPDNEYFACAALSYRAILRRRAGDRAAALRLLEKAIATGVAEPALFRRYEKLRLLGSASAPPRKRGAFRTRRGAEGRGTPAGNPATA